ncbi:MAG: lytic transglycosylase domain-containing protein [Candidatus Aenigmarchaeota archaeon]|nr:lytic transglycosylase domain-containing protein [Candidatus Aenigmarchaeota archaeon]
MPITPENDMLAARQRTQPIYQAETGYLNPSVIREMNRLKRIRSVRKEDYEKHRPYTDYMVSALEDPRTKRLREMDNSLALLLAIAQRESGAKHYNEKGSVIRNPAYGAIGIMQVIPPTGKDICGMSEEDLKDSKKNVLCGALVLSKYLEDCRGNIEGALALYNGGYHVGCNGKHYLVKSYVAGVTNSALSFRN